MDNCVPHKLSDNEHLPYSSDLSPTNYHLFKYFDHFIKEKAFRNERDVDFVNSRRHNCFCGCIDYNGSYFE
ncbi:Histone-lysine N-methyltransferase SETMAR [Habropoda laboriosa]|uniref:Histone-lysine N-methyltransferase SETMAR n=1 Tax=Habropoda laboriosa TaxID=597456 RepID=A0A0L7QYF1_9HYME|nr:Histone-lysine N-methyltransferase SETMAR [Habropoda laboriosa]